MLDLKTKVHLLLLKHRAKPEKKEKKYILVSTPMTKGSQPTARWIEDVPEQIGIKFDII